MPATGTANDVTGAKPNAITSAAAAAAACGAPNSAGSASGLRSRPCSAAPDRPSVAPINRGEQRARQADVAHDDAGRAVAREQPAQWRRAATARPGRPSARARRARRSAPQARFRDGSGSRVPVPDLAASGLVRRRSSDGDLTSADPASHEWLDRRDALALSYRLPPRGCAADAPRRVVSFNQCGDQLVLALADPQQIAGLSPYAADPTLSAVAEQAKAYPRLDWQAESTIALQPDLVLIGQNGPADHPAHAACAWASASVRDRADLRSRCGPRSDSRRRRRCSGIRSAARSCWPTSMRRACGCTPAPKPPYHQRAAGQSRRLYGRHAKPCGGTARGSRAQATAGWAARLWRLSCRWKSC